MHMASGNHRLEAQATCEWLTSKQRGSLSFLKNDWLAGTHTRSIEHNTASPRPASACRGGAWRIIKCRSAIKMGHWDVSTPVCAVHIAQHEHAAPLSSRQAASPVAPHCPTDDSMAPQTVPVAAFLSKLRIAPPYDTKQGWHTQGAHSPRASFSLVAAHC